MADFTIKRGDSWPPIVATLSDAVGQINLTTAASVNLLFKTTTGSIAYTKTCTITTPSAGVVTYVWTAADASSGPLSEVNTFNIEWEITWADASKTTVPNEGYKSLSVVPDLG